MNIILGAHGSFSKLAISVVFVIVWLRLDLAHFLDATGNVAQISLHPVEISIDNVKHLGTRGKA
ncbi:hypothetical protein ASF76_10290 [Microbacterium sp. Leaf151]|nr:hypothetical protein ASF76_10290 [Microbacterium sp. Leaf151]